MEEGLSNRLKILNLISNAVMPEKSSKIGHQPTLSCSQSALDNFPSGDLEFPALAGWEIETKSLAQLGTAVEQ